MSNYTQIDLLEDILPESHDLVATHDLYELSTTLSQLYDDAIKLASTKARNTEETYAKGRKVFFEWCETRHIDPLSQPPEMLTSAFVASLADQGYYKPGSIVTYVNGVIDWYNSEGRRITIAHSVGLKKTIYGMYRKMGRAVNRKSPATLVVLKKMLDKIPQIDNRGYVRPAYLRDRSLLLMAFVGAFRLSEVLAIKMEHMQDHRDGYIVTVPRSKTDQQGSGITKLVPYGTNPDTCPVRALRDWLAYAEITSGYVYRPLVNGQFKVDKPCGHTMYYNLVKRCVDNSSAYSTHSMRAGFVTEAASRGVSETLIMQQTGHKNLDSMRSYIRIGQTFANSAATRVGL